MYIFMIIRTFFFQNFNEISKNVMKLLVCSTSDSADYFIFRIEKLCFNQMFSWKSNFHVSKYDSKEAY